MLQKGVHKIPFSVPFPLFGDAGMTPYYNTHTLVPLVLSPSFSSLSSSLSSLFFSHLSPHLFTGESLAASHPPEVQYSLSGIAVPSAFFSFTLKHTQHLKVLSAVDASFEKAKGTWRKRVLSSLLSPPSSLLFPLSPLSDSLSQVVK